MFDHIENFRTHVNRAIREYENFFTEKNPMPEHRSLDVISIRVILDEYYPNLSSYMDAVKRHLSQIKTGWWIFKTGRSRLKNSIMPIIQAYENPVTQDLIDQITAMNESLCDVKGQLNELKAEKNLDSVSPLLLVSEGDEPQIEPVKSAIFSFSLEENDTSWLRMRK